MVDERLNLKMTHAFEKVHETAQSKHIHNRMAAYLVAIERVARAVRLRGWV
jgi:glutamate dehydrogenase (NAD(P)+)